MKRFLATTAIALIMANGAFAENHVAADGTATDSTMSTEAPAADGTMTTTDGMTAPDASADTATDGTMSTDMETEGDAAMEPSTDSTMDTTTDGTMTTDTATDSAATTMETTDSTDMAAAPTMTMDGYDTLMNADVTAEELTGTPVYGPNDENVGEIGDLVIGEDGTVTDVIVDVGGFLGLGEKPVSIAYDSVQLLKQTDGDDMRAYVNMTEDQLKELPAYEAMEDATTEEAPSN